MTSDNPAPAPQGPPATPDEAVRIVRARYAQPRLPDGSPAELQVHEFDIGYLVCPAPPPPTESTVPLMPSEPGGAKIVVSKETGETVTVPNFPTEQAIALYRKNREHTT